MRKRVNVFWFRRDLRLEDNVGLSMALNSGLPVLPIFIFDSHILEELEPDDARVGFIYDSLKVLNEKLLQSGSFVKVLIGDVTSCFEEVTAQYDVQEVFTNEDYEPYARERDTEIASLLHSKKIGFRAFKDQVVFGPVEVLKSNGEPYLVFTPYKNCWLKTLEEHPEALQNHPLLFENFMKGEDCFPNLKDVGFVESEIKVKAINRQAVAQYDKHRDYPALEATSNLGPYLRFGLVSIRQEVAKAKQQNAVFLSELIWREFFMQILYHYPEVVKNSFKTKYDKIVWRNNEHEFDLWCKGETGYPLVDAGMRELNQTGYMHNRVRMVVASFLCKHLLIDWRWGEAYFASKLLDYELSSNNGNWQWVAGTGCDAAPYFRVFNPHEQLKKFDPQLKYVRKWIPEYDSLAYPSPMVDHKEARLRAINHYKQALDRA